MRQFGEQGQETGAACSRRWPTFSARSPKPAQQLLRLIGLALWALLAGCTCGKTQIEVRCGNGACEVEAESCFSCPSDCPCALDEVCSAGKCQARCGNGVCDTSENCSSCASDCKCTGSGMACVTGQCRALCGNGVCDTSAGEGCSSCPGDCTCTLVDECFANACRLHCGNATCDTARGEGCGTCARDCPCSDAGLECSANACLDRCGNGSCQSALGETCATCAADCACTGGAACVLGACLAPDAGPGDAGQVTDGGALDAGVLCNVQCAFSWANAQDLKVNADSGTVGPTVAVDPGGAVYVAFGQLPTPGAQPDGGPPAWVALAKNAAGPSFSQQGAINSTGGAYYFGTRQLVSTGAGKLAALWEGGNSHVRASTTSGTTWLNDAQVDALSTNGIHPSLTAGGGTLYAAWTGYDGSKYDAYFSTSTNGSTWTAPVRLNNDATQDDATAVAVDGSLVVVAWNTFPGDVFVARSVNGGQSFGAPQQVNDVAGKARTSNQPFLAVRGLRVHVAWSDSRTDPEGDVYLDTSLDGAATWGADVKVNDITTRYQEAPVVRIAPNDGRVWVAWQDLRNNNYDVYAAASADGACFCKSARLNRDGALDQMNPSFVVDAQGRLHAAWRDARSASNFDIFYNAATPSP